MKLLTLFAALLFPVSLVIADDYLYLRFKASVDLVNTNSTAYKVFEDRIMDGIG